MKEIVAENKVKYLLSFVTALHYSPNIYCVLFFSVHSSAGK